MEHATSLLIPALLALVLVRTILLPVRFLMKISIHSLCGFACLWLLNTSASITGVAIPINAATVVTAGTLGLPGIGLLAVLEMAG